MPVLIVSEPNQVPYFVSLHEALVIGRQETSDLVLPDRSVSRQHARLSPDTGDGYVICDLGSKLGTFVNEQRVPEQTRLHPGDRIQIGRVSLVYKGGLEGESDRIVLHQQPTVEAAMQHVGEDDARRLRLLCQVGAALETGGDVAALLESTLDAILDVLNATRGVISALDAVPGAGRTVERVRGAALRAGTPIARNVLDAVAVRREAVIVGGPAWASEGPGGRPAMAAPLLRSNRQVGFVYVEREGGAPDFRQADLAFVTVLAHLTAALLENSLRHESVDRAVEALRTRAADVPLLGKSPAMASLLETVQRYAAADGVPVLVRGESGTGKELVAHTLHQLSPRAEQPFVAVNCAAIPETLIEAELFGHEKGAFTGAVRAHRGKFQLAHRGTLFLDEIGDLGAAAQAKVLRAIELGEIQPAGSERTLRVDIRVVAATHKDLREEIHLGRFREDLYYRLCVGEVQVPPLRERAEDIPLLAEAFLATAGRRMARRFAGFTPEALALLGARRWSGNVRELRNEVERAAIRSRGETIEAADLTPVADALPTAPSMPAAAASLATQLGQVAASERELVGRAFDQARGNLSEAARLLGITRVMMKRRVERLGLKRDGGGIK